MVAGTTRSWPNRAAKQRDMVDPVQQGTTAPSSSGFTATLRNADSSCVAFTVIHSTSYGCATLSARSTGTRKVPRGLSSDNSAG